MQFNEIKKKILWSLGNFLSVSIVTALCKTLFIEEDNKASVEQLLENKQNIIIVFWHGTMIVPWFLMRGKNLSTIISKSKDGEILSRLLTKWTYNVRRGSSSKGGKEVLENLIEDAKNFNSIAITPDGPRGPDRVMKAGATVIAKKTGLPIILAGTAYKQRLKLKSWDNFEVPMFFSKACIKYSYPIYVDKNLSYDETDKLINKLGSELNSLQHEMEQCC